MTAKTLFTITDSIQVSRIRLSRFPMPELNNIPWTKEEETLFYKLMLDYGKDIGLIQSFFPNRTRNQIKRKHRDICEMRKKAMMRQEQRRVRQHRKSYFDDEILEQKLMKWPSKPNNQGNSSSDQTI